MKQINIIEQSVELIDSGALEEVTISILTPPEEVTISIVTPPGIPPIAPLFSYSDITILLNAASITVTNNTGIYQLCIIFFRIDVDEIYVYQFNIPGNSSHVFSHVFETLNTIEHTIEVLNSSFIVVRSAIMPPFSIFMYGTFTQVRDGADVICSLPVTNNSVEQTCIIYFKLGDFLVQLSSVIAADATHAFTYTFLDIDNDITHTIIAHDSSMTIVGTVTVDIVAPFEFSWIGTGTMNIRIGMNGLFSVFYQNDALQYLQKFIANNESYDTLSVVYSNVNTKRGYFSANKYCRYMYLISAANIYIAEHELEKLTNLTYLYVNLGNANVFITQHEIEKLKKLTTLFIRLIANIYIAEHEIEKLTNLTYLYIQGCDNCAIAEHEIEKLTNLTTLLLQSVGTSIKIAEHEIEKLTNLTSISLQGSAIYVSEYETNNLNFIGKTTQIIITQCNVKVASNEIFPTHYINFNNSRLSQQSVDNLFISCYSQLLSGFVPGTKNLNAAGTNNAKVTAASLTARNYLAAQGYVLTYNT